MMAVLCLFVGVLIGGGVFQLAHFIDERAKRIDEERRERRAMGYRLAQARHALAEVGLAMKGDAMVQRLCDAGLAASADGESLE